MPAPKREKQSLVNLWLDLSPEDRFSRGLPLDRLKLRRHLGIGATTLREWEGRHWANKLGENLEKAGETEVEEIFDLKVWLKETSKERWEAVLRAAKNGNASAQKLLAQAADEVTEKQEVTHKIDGGDIAKAVIRARREREKDSGVDAVSGEFRLLSDNLRLSTRQGKRKNRKVAKLEASS